MAALAKGSPNAPVVLACASAAGRLCTALAADKEAGPRLGGILFLGANVKEIGEAAAQLTKTGYRIPVFIGHGSKDPVIDWARQELFFNAVRTAAPDYPIRFTLYAAGFHGTPMRMVDWREVINWMIDVRGS
jgi:dienelactone hydrolase